MPKRHELTDEEWEHLRGLLPPEKPVTGRQAHSHRQVVNGILWVIRTGAPWRDLPERYGNWATVYSRLRRWRKAGVWERVWQQVEQRAQAAGEIAWELQFLDGTIVRAHQHAAGAKKSAAEEEALGRSHGGLSTKIHLRVDGKGRLLNFLLTPGQAREIRVAQALFASGTRARRPKRIVADKGYGSRAFRAYLRRRGIRYTIPHMRHERYPGPFDPALYRLRNQVERLINRLKQFRRLATRYDKLADSYRTLILIVAIRLAL